MDNGEVITLVIVLAILWAAANAMFSWIRGMYHGWKLPPPSISPALVQAYEKQVFREICRRSDGPGLQISMNGYFAEQGWNRADAMLILAEPLKHRLIKAHGWQFGQYGPTRKGWVEYRRNFMWTGGGESVNISATTGGFVVANVSSSGAVAQAGYGNSADLRSVTHHQLIDALRQDARSAEPDEAARAHEYADDLAEAIQTENTDRTGRILGRINTLLETARAAFTLTRDMLPPLS
ncbi:hypothetical protein [Streptomyces niveus]|uniref:hypothetical protein n=1 Tax=Streptomyces niveus TaxID=193462 RepID=UPI00341D18B7